MDVPAAIAWLACECSIQRVLADAMPAAPFALPCPRGTSAQSPKNALSWFYSVEAMTPRRGSNGGASPPHAQYANQGAPPCPADLARAFEPRRTLVHIARLPQQVRALVAQVLGVLGQPAGLKLLG